MADLLTDDELELAEGKRKRNAQPEQMDYFSPDDAIGSPIAPDVIRKAGGLSYSPQPAIATEPSKLPDSLTQPQPESIGAPLQLTPSMAPRPAYEKYQQVQNSPAGVEKLHGFGGGLVKGLEAVGTAINPGMMAGIPGTRMHHQMDVGHARTAAEEENREILSQGEEQLHNAQSEEQLALAKKNAAGPPKKYAPTVIAGPNGEPVAANFDPQAGTYHNPDTGEQIMGAKKYEKPATPPHGNDFDSYYAKWMKDNKQPDTAANQLRAHKEWETQGGKEPQGTWMPLYDDKGRVVGAWNAATGQHRTSPPDALPGHTAPGAHIASTAEAATEKKIAPLKAVIEEADKAQTLKDMADHGNAEADVDLALTFFKSMRSSTSGGSGIRFTQQENNLIMDARSLWGGLEVKGNKIFSNGQPLSKEQRQQILDVINVHKQAAQRQLQEIQQGGGATPTSTPQSTGGGGFKPF